MNIEAEKLIRVTASEDSTRFAISQPIYKEDYGLYLFIAGLELPEIYTVDFSKYETSGDSISMLGNADGVLIPRQFIQSGEPIFAFLYLTGDGIGRTVYKFKIPNRIRPDRTNEEPEPEEQSIIDQLIAELNSAVEHYPRIIDNFWYVWDTTAETYVNTNVSAIGVVDPLHFYISDGGDLMMTVGEE